MDCTKAFDTVMHSVLFKKLLEAKVPPIVVRLLIISYLNQTADVRWGDKYSKEFSLKNGVKQGGVISPILFCFYMNDLFRKLKQSKSGCYIGQYFAGVYGYADDLLLICPSRKGLQEMVTIAEEYAEQHNIKFSTDPIPKKSKTKGIIFRKKPMNIETEKISLCGNLLPWIDSAKYLGNKWTNTKETLNDDVKIKRAKYIEKNCELIQEFFFVHPELLCKLNRIYNSSFTGSVLWDLTSRNVQMLCNSWSVSVRHMWKLPNETHRFFIEPLSGIHAKNMLMTRFINFIQSIEKGHKSAPLYLLEKIRDDTMTVTGRNIKYICEELEEENISNININSVKKSFQFQAIPKDEEWKIGIVKELTDVKMNKLDISFDNNVSLEEAEIDDLIQWITTH